jgi:hydroxymethylpyrimidine pyrophosphatase-like HAD family hydrolase
MHLLIALYFDDTLLQPSGRISPRTAMAVRALHKRGVIIALASGRMLPIAEQLGFAPALVSYNGAQVNLAAEVPLLYHCPVPGALAEQVIEYAKRRNVHLNLYHNDLLFCSQTDNWQTRVYHEQTGAIM